MIDLGFEVIDLHAHLRENPQVHLMLAKDAGISKVVVMPNTLDCIDCIEKILIYKKLCGKFANMVYFTSAMTVSRKGKIPVDVESLKKYIIGFSDDGNCLEDLDILKYILKKDVLVMAHLEPEVEMLEKYISVYSKSRSGRLHFQHISKKESVKIIRKGKKLGLKITCEVTPHHLYYSNEFENHEVNPPLGNTGDIKALKKGLTDETIDCIASDYAPIPRPKGTGFASFLSFIPLCYGLVLDGTISKKQLEDLISTNPRKIIGLK